MTTRLSRRRFAASALLALLPCWLPPPTADAASDPVVKVKGGVTLPSYDITEVPIPWVEFVSPQFLQPAINDSGQVASSGVVRLNTLRGPKGDLPIRYHAYRSNAAATSVTQLTPLVRSGNSWAYSINNDGTVAGASDTGEGGVRIAKYLPNGTTQDLGFLDTGGDAFGYDINAAGTVVGEARDNDGGSRAVRHTPSTGLQLLTTKVSHSIARAINNNGVIVGEHDDGEGFFVGFRYQNGEFESIGSLEGGSFSSAYDVNSSGAVTGYGTYADDALRHAILSQPDSELVDLGALSGGDSSIGYSINDAGVVVGQSEYSIDRGGTPPTNTQEHAFVWSAAFGMRDLNSLLKSGTGWELLAATGINNKGQIVGYGLRGERLTVFRLTPAGSAPGRVQLSSLQVRFGMIKVGQSRRRRLVIQNVGNGPFSGRILQTISPFTILSVGGRSLTGTGTTGDFPISLAPGQRTTLEIQFKPRLQARFRQRLFVANDDTSFPTLAIRMAGDACGRTGR